MSTRKNSFEIHRIHDQAGTLGGIHRNSTPFCDGPQHEACTLLPGKKQSPAVQQLPFQAAVLQW